MERNQFTFYRSYWEAIAELKKPERQIIIEAIIKYALYGEEPNISGTAKAMFTLIAPTLDASARKAIAGSAGGSHSSKREATEKQNESKQKANDKQSKTEASDKQTGSKWEANGKQMGSKWEAKRKGVRERVRVRDRVRDRVKERMFILLR